MEIMVVNKKKSKKCLVYTNDTMVKVKRKRLEGERESEHVQDNCTSFHLNTNTNKSIYKMRQKKLTRNKKDELECSSTKKIKTINDWSNLEDDDSTDSLSDSSSSFENNTERKKNISYSLSMERLNDDSDEIIKPKHRRASICMEEETLSMSDRMKLQNLNIRLIHEIPAQHTIESYAGCRGLKYNEKKLFEKYGPLRKGTFSLVEDEIIKNNWKMFCKLHDWKEDNVKPFIWIKDNGKYYIHFKERQKFVQFLANGLPWRSLYNVNYRFKNLYDNHISHRYTSNEDKKIINYIKKKKKNVKENKVFSNLSKILNRSKQSIRSHYELVLKKRYVREKEEISTSKPMWTLSLIKRYITELLRLTKSDHIEELKNAIIPKIIWTKLEIKLNIDHKRLKHFWLSQLHMQLFCPDIIYMNDVKIQLIEYMYVKGIANKREIIWANIVKYFDGMTSYFLRKVFISLMQEFGVREYEKTFLDTIEYLYEKKIPEIQNDTLDRYLPRIKYTTDENIQI